MGDVVKISSKVNIDSVFVQGWVCGCGGTTWILFADTKCVCASCSCYSTKIKVIEGDPDAG